MKVPTTGPRTGATWVTRARHPELLGNESGSVAQDRGTSVRGDGESRADLELTVRCGGAHTAYLVLFDEQARRLGEHTQLEVRERGRLTREEIQQVPLRRENEKIIWRRQAAEVDHGNALTVDDGVNGGQAREW